MVYDFDSVVNRRGTNSFKWDFPERFFGTNDLLPLWVADMDFRAPPSVLNALKKVADHGIFGYTGIPDSYYSAVIDWMKKRHGWIIKKEWFVFTPGVVTALNMLIRTFTQPGDGVIIQTPVYYPFFSCITNNNCQVIDNPLRFQNGQYFMDFNDLKQKINAHTRLMILCSPHNPIGRVWTTKELSDLGEVCHEKNVLIIADEIHGDIVYHGSNHVPLASLSPVLADRTITCTGASKTFNLAGLHTSNIIIPNPELRRLFQTTLLRCAVHSPDPFGIAGTEAAYRDGEQWLEELIEYLHGNILYMKDYIKNSIPKISITQPQGTYLVWLDCRQIGIPQSELKDFMIYKAKVGIEEGMPFGAKEPGYFRINIACPRTTLHEALERIENAIDSAGKTSAI